MSLARKRNAWFLIAVDEEQVALMAFATQSNDSTFARKCPRNARCSKWSSATGSNVLMNVGGEMLIDVLLLETQQMKLGDAKKVRVDPLSALAKRCWSLCCR